MRIAMLAPPWYSVPPAAYGGVEMLVAGLADGLVARGHDVLLVSAGGNGTLAAGARTLEHPADDRLGDEVVSLLHASRAEAAVRAFEPDVVNDHTLPGLLAAEHRPFPTVATVHGPPTGEYGELLHAATSAHLVAISHAQRRGAPRLPWAATAHNGIPVRAYPVLRTKDDFLFFLGRMHPDKGVLQAIEVARRAGVRLVIAARIHGRDEEEFFRAQVAPRLGDGVVFVGEVGFDEKTRLLSQARALLFPLQWEEPYGLVVAEAQACGTPVLSLRRGAIPELVIDGVTGWLREHHLDLVGAVARLPELSTRRCREHALESLDISTTVRRYEDVFRWAVQTSAGRSARGRLHVALPPGGADPVRTSRTVGATHASTRVTTLLTKETS